MAQVIRPPHLEEFVAHDLENQLAFWRTVPEQAIEWDTWDELSKDDFRLQWPIDRESLKRLRDAVAANLLDERQQCDWRELQRLIAEHRATVEWMLDGPI